MTTQDSESELAGRLGASLTPRVPRITVQQRGEQNSGLFDVGALYAASVEQIMRRARVAREQPPVFGVAGVAQPASVALPAPWVAAPTRAHEEDLDLDALFLVRPRGIGWFGVAVAWLATTAIGATIAMTVPAHTVARSHAPELVVAAVPPVALPAPTTPAPPLAVVATPPAVASPVAVVVAPAVTAKKPIVVVAPHARMRTVTASAQADVAPAIPPAQRVAPVEAPAPKAAAASPPPAAGGSSLEDLMRRAVEADSKKH
jgi:hypothetical protein